MYLWSVYLLDKRRQLHAMSLYISSVIESLVWRGLKLSLCWCSQMTVMRFTILTACLLLFRPTLQAVCNAGLGMTMRHTLHGILPGRLVPSLWPAICSQVLPLPAPGHTHTHTHPDLYTPQKPLLNSQLLHRILFRPIVCDVAINLIAACLKGHGFQMCRSAPIILKIPFLVRI